MNMPAGIYPFSTQDGKAIPLDIIKPKGLISCAYTNGVVAHCVIPPDGSVGVLTSSFPCILRFGAVDMPVPPVDGVYYPDAVYIPAGGIITVALTPGPVSVVGAATKSGVLYIQLIEQWAGLGLPTQYGRK